MGESRVCAQVVLDPAFESKTFVIALELQK